VRIAIDIDSTLHHYWELLEEVAERRFGVALTYRDQTGWDIDALAPEQLAACVRETHGDELVLSAEPYPGAVEAVSRWHAQGHFIHITSHRSAGAHDATERWLRQIGLAFDELYCSYDKLSRCGELAIDLLIDDSPVNLQGALDREMAAATIIHPWNRELCARTPVICAPDWPTLSARLDPLLTEARPASS
jgi:uncharacterized HAD superfamily protein